MSATTSNHLGYRWLSGLKKKNLPANGGDAGRGTLNPLVRKNPWRRKWQPTAVFLPGKFHEQRSLVSCSHGVAKSRTQLKEHAVTQQPPAVAK